jgi:hypothetical protein
LFILVISLHQEKNALLSLLFVFMGNYIICVITKTPVNLFELLKNISLKN